MAHHKSTIKRIRQTKKRTQRNRYYRTRLKNLSKAVRVAVEENDREKALEAFRIANKKIHSMVSKGFLKKRTASRKVSRLNILINKMQVA